MDEIGLLKRARPALSRSNPGISLCCRALPPSTTVKAPVRQGGGRTVQGFLPFSRPGVGSASEERPRVITPLPAPGNIQTTRSTRGPAPRTVPPYLSVSLRYFESSLQLPVDVILIGDGIMICTRRNFFRPAATIRCLSRLSPSVRLEKETPTHPRSRCR